MTEHDFRRMALALQGAVEGAHMGHPDFRVSNRIFATLHHDRTTGALMLTPEQQEHFLREQPDAFQPASGAWGRGGATVVRLAPVGGELLGEAMTLAFQNILQKNAANPARKRPSSAGTFSARTPGRGKRR